MWVDDIISIVNNRKLITHLATKFTIKHLGKLAHFLNVDFKVTPNVSIDISQPLYITNLLENFGMTNCKPVDTPAVKHTRNEELLSAEFPFMELIGSLIYLACISRPDISYATSYLTRHMSNPSTSDWQNAKRILRYLKGTPTLGITLLKEASAPIIQAYSDSDYGGDLATSRSTSGTLITIGTLPIIWKSNLQRLVALSSTEAELYALTSTTKELSWILELAAEIKAPVRCPIDTHVDNQSTISFTETTRVKANSKHIATKYHFVRDLVTNKTIAIHYIPTASNPADILTKPLPRPAFISHREALLPRTTTVVQGE